MEGDTYKGVSQCLSEDVILCETRIRRTTGSASGVPERIWDAFFGGRSRRVRTTGGGAFPVRLRRCSTWNLSGDLVFDSRLPDTEGTHLGIQELLWT